MEDLEREQQREVKVNKVERKESMKTMKEENASTNARAGERGFGGGGRGHDGPPGKAGSEGPGGEGFNYDQIIEGINLNSLLGGSVQQQQEVPVAQVVPQGSRFSQFFAPRQPGGIGEDGSRRGSLQELQKELGQEGPTIAIPSPNQEERYFAPISPAAQTRTMTNNLMDMIGKGPAQQPPVVGGGGRVQELEEGIRRQLGLGLPQPPPPQVHPQQQQGHPENVYRAHAAAVAAGHMPVKDQVHAQEQENMSAFKKLVSKQYMGVFTVACIP